MVHILHDHSAFLAKPDGSDFTQVEAERPWAVPGVLHGAGKMARHFCPNPGDQTVAWIYTPGTQVITEVLLRHGTTPWIHIKEF